MQKLTHVLDIMKLPKRTTNCITPIRVNEVGMKTHATVEVVCLAHNDDSDLDAAQPLSFIPHFQSGPIHQVAYTVC